ncbi:ATP-binding cassette domain-containing protein [Acinetobacter guillouiae]|uniref:ATP-binding cassette domain-containing protein n=1 Tax=Acinetobacter guillouiae TaxID=106649 RepID=A0A8X8GBR9_ACIGI|nr:ATP-binding cassette domain-containing protein [Acinetobacter guillouiae]MCF0263864.1 ATP-binding cassette domain-containing protein [Acinetobacter guillouiae]
MSQPIQRIDETNFKINKLLFLRFFNLIKPFWWRKEALLSWVLMIIMISLTIGLSIFSGYLSFLTAEVTNAQLGKEEKYWLLFFKYTLFEIGAYLVGILIVSLLVKKISLQWREWLTQHLTHKYLENRAYYDILYKQDIDNPDQRIQEQVAPVCDMLTSIPRILVTMTFGIGIHVAILISISSAYLWTQVLYITIVGLVTYYFAIPLIKKNWLLIVAEANLRSSLSHVRENSETIAFYRGENVALENIKYRILKVFQRNKSILFFTTKVDTIQSFLNFLPEILVVLLLVPLFFSHEITYGTIGQASMSAAMLVGNIKSLIYFIPMLADAAPKAARIAEIQEKVQKMKLEQTTQNPKKVIHFFNSQDIELHNLNLNTPNAEQQLVKNLNLTIKSGQNLIIMGRTGVGKSSLMRVMAGLWNRGQGQVGLPTVEQLLFVPQRPYMTQGSLWSQLIYPATETTLSNEQIIDILHRVNLSVLLERYESLDVVRDWRHELSLGQQQCVSMARLLINHPKYAFLDEASSALDQPIEAKVYQQLIDAGITLISISHRESLIQFHQQKLELLPQGAWEIVPLAQQFTTTLTDYATLNYINKNQPINEHIEPELETKLNKKDFKIDALFFNRIWLVVKPFWFHKTAWKSWLMMAFVILSAFISSAVTAYISFKVATQTNALVNFEQNKYWILFALILFLKILFLIFSIFSNFIGTLLNFYWQKWLTEYMSETYLSHKNFYEIGLNDQIDNPDQRIQAEAKPLIQSLSSWISIIAYSISGATMQFGILYYIHPQLSFLTITYATFYLFITFFIYRPLIRRSFLVTKSEADLRSSLLYVRENAENIAFYRGEQSEKRHIFSSLRIVIKNNWLMSVYEKMLYGIVYLLDQVIIIIPVIMLTPLYFNNKISFGTLGQGIAATALTFSAFNMLSGLVAGLSDLAPNVVRLSEIIEKLNQIKNQSSKEHRKEHFKIIPSNILKLENVSIKTPKGDLPLVKNLNLEIHPQHHYVIIGQTGIGKSSLLRVLAGLWNNGTGTLYQIPDEDYLFLPQRPYVTEGTLRSQIIYPQLDTNLSDEQLQKILEQVQLGDLTEKQGDLDTYNNWGRILSLGEQQRLGFARVLIHKSKYIFLDEATSAVDKNTEQLLYETLLQSGVTLISICHKQSAWHYHTHYLKLMPKGQYEIGLIKDIQH